MDREFGKRPLHYHSFVLTLWFESGSDFPAPGVWRMSLEDPHTSVRLGFKGLTELTHFLESWTNHESEGLPIDE